MGHFPILRNERKCWKYMHMNQWFTGAGLRQPKIMDVQQLFSMFQFKRMHTYICKCISCTLATVRLRHKDEKITNLSGSLMTNEMFLATYQSLRFGKRGKTKYPSSSHCSVRSRFSDDFQTISLAAKVLSVLQIPIIFHAILSKFWAIEIIMEK